MTHALGVSGGPRTLDALGPIGGEVLILTEREAHKPIIIVVIESREKNGDPDSAIKPSTESDQAQLKR